MSARIEQNSSSASGVAHKVGLTGLKSSCPIPSTKSFKEFLKSGGNSSPILANICDTSFSLESASENCGYSDSIISNISAVASGDISPKNAFDNSLCVITFAILSANARVCSLSAKAAAPTPKLANISTIELLISSWLTSAPHMESLMILERLETPPSVTSPETMSPVVSSALQIASPNNSHIFTNNFTNMAIISSDIASFSAANNAANISEILPTQAKGLTSFGRVMSSMFLQNGSSKSLIKSKTVGLNKGGLGQSIAIMALEINLAPGKRFN